MVNLLHNLSFFLLISAICDFKFIIRTLQFESLMTEPQNLLVEFLTSIETYKRAAKQRLTLWKQLASLTLIIVRCPQSIETIKHSVIDSLTSHTSVENYVVISDISIEGVHDI